MSTQPLVYVIQEARHLNLAPALEWGSSIIPLFPSGDVGNADPARIMETLLERLETYRDVDYLILSGDPELLAMSMLAIARIGRVGVVNLLKFDKYTQSYKLRMHYL